MVKPEGLGDFPEFPPQYGLGQIPGTESGDEVSQKLKQNVKLEYNFLTFSYTFFSFMNKGAELGQYFAQPHSSNNSEDAVGLNPQPPFWVRQLVSDNTNPGEQLR